MSQSERELEIELKLERLFAGTSLFSVQHHGIPRRT
jgi:hypothetical protein